MDLLAIPSLVATALLLWLCLAVVVRPPPPPMWPSLPLGWVTVILFVVGDLWIHLAPDTPDPWVPISLLYTGLIFLPPTWWLLAHRFAEVLGHPFAWGRSRWVYAPFGFAGLFWLAMLTNPWHGQFLTPGIEARSEYHWLWWIYATFEYSLVLSCIALYATLAYRVDSKIARSRIYYMLVGSAINIVFSLTFVLLPFALPFDPTAMGFCISASMYLVGIYKTNLFALSPVAMKTVIQHQPSGILVTDPAGALLYWNPAAANVLDVASLAADTNVYHWLAERLYDPDDSSRRVEVETLRRSLEEQGGSRTTSTTCSSV